MGTSGPWKALGTVGWQVAHMEVCPPHGPCPAFRRCTLLGFPSLSEATCGLQPWCLQTAGQHSHAVRPPPTKAADNVPQSKQGKCRGVADSCVLLPGASFCGGKGFAHTCPEAGPPRQAAGHRLWFDPQGPLLWAGARICEVPGPTGVELVAEHLRKELVIHTWPEGGSSSCVWSSWECPSRKPLK